MAARYGWRWERPSTAKGEAVAASAVERAVARLDELYEIGGGEGANRPGLSAEEEAAHRLAAAWMAEAGLTVSRDAAGNLYGRRPGRRPELGEVWSGSHLDSVPDGGRFDGALGVVAALEAVAALEPQARTLTVVAFRDEEGWRFGRGFLGSRAVTGTLAADALDAADSEGVTVRAALAALGFASDPAAGPLVPPPAAFVELHVEQGPVLARLGQPVGIVDAIAGMVELVVRFEGEAGHAGTTPMAGRRDAALAAARFQLAVAEAAAAVPGGVATIGTITLEPGASNVIAGAADLVVDARAPDDAALAALEAAIAAAADRASAAAGCTARLAAAARSPAVACDPAVAAALRAAAPGAPTLASGAGHDAQVLAAAGVPAGMLFVRSLAGGASHSPREHTAPADVERAIAVLERALRALAGGVSPAGRPG
jgi:allantoate deiminase